MKVKRIVRLSALFCFFIMMAALLSSCRVPERYDDPEKMTPIQFSFAPGAVFPDRPFVKKLKVGLPFSTPESSLNGFDVAVFASFSPNVNGMQNSVFVNASDDVTGMQNSLVNICDSVGGMQAGICNTLRSMVGAQFGLVNVTSGKMEGAQFGLVNTSDKLYGMQFGLVNINSKGPLPFMILINYDFSKSE